MNPSVLGLIPARGGSKAVPRKNIRLLGGKPLILHTIEPAMKSAVLSRLVTSTDDPEIAAVARTAGSEIVNRPAELARDDTPMLPVIQHAVAEMERRHGRVDIVVLLQPTVPFREADDIDGAVAVLMRTPSDSVVSLCRVYDFHPARMKRIEDDRIVPYCEREVEGMRRQDLPAAYHRNGALYVMWRDLVMERRTIFGDVSRPYIMPLERSLNIDEEQDFLVAETLLAKIERDRKSQTVG